MVSEAIPTTPGGIVNVAMDEQLARFSDAAVRELARIYVSKNAANIQRAMRQPVQWGRQVGIGPGAMSRTDVEGALRRRR